MINRDNLHTFVFHKVKLTVKKEFLKLLEKDLDKTEVEELCFKLNLEEYLHDPYEPAAVNLETNEVCYYLHGKEYKEKSEWEKESHKLLFSNDMETILNENG
jgi:hypothetical protein